MPLLIGGITALVALAAGILGEVDPLASVGRASLAFLLGLVGAHLWYGFLGGLSRPTSAPASDPAPTRAEEIPVAQEGLE